MDSNNHLPNETKSRKNRGGNLAQWKAGSCHGQFFLLGEAHFSPFQEKSCWQPAI